MIDTESFKLHFSREFGLELIGDIKVDGAFHYLGTAEDKGRKPIRYCVHLDQPANIYFNDLKRGIRDTWYPEGQAPLVPQPL